MIPKIIHFCWLSGDPYPEIIIKCLDSWKKILPDYEIKLWDTKTFDIQSTKWTAQAFEMKKYAFASDYIRFYALYNYGGIYLDSDVEVLKSFDDFLHNKWFFGYEYTGSPEAAIVGAEKGQVWINQCMKWYENKEFVDYYGKETIIAPLVLQSGFERTISYKLIDDEKEHFFEGGCILPYSFFSPKNGFNGDIKVTNDTYAIHHFNTAWLNTNTVSIKIKKTIHMLLIKFLGKKRYNKVMYLTRKRLHKV